LKTHGKLGLIGSMGIGSLLLVVSGGAALAQSPAASMAPAGSMMPAASPFGAACSAIPADGAGSLSGMAAAPVATAASANPLLTTLVTAVTAAGLVDTLNSATDITVFAPTDDAFKALDPATLAAALADPKGLLTTVLTYHVVSGRITPETLVGTHTTLEGADLTVAGSGDAFTVNGTANIICGNVQTANATVYIVDGVLLPPAPAASMAPGASMAPSASPAQ